MVAEAGRLARRRLHKSKAWSRNMLALHGNAADGAGSIPIDWNTNAEGDLDEIGGCFRGGLSIEWCRCNVCDPL